jgi:MFS transporter, FHS family, L-fucose permease
VNPRVLPIFLAFFVMGFVDAVGTVIGFAQREFAISGAMAGLLPFFGFIAFALFSVPAGVLAARQGKRFVMLLALGVVLLGQLLPSITLTHYATLLVSIFLIGVGMTLLQVAGNPIMRDVSAPDRYARNLTFAQFIKALGSISGPYATTALIAMGFAWSRIFPVFALVTLTALFAVTVLSVEERRGDGEPAGLGSSLRLLKDPVVAAFVAGIFLYVGAEVGLNSWLATHLARTYGMDLGSEATRLGPGLFFICLASGRFLGSLILTFLPARSFFLLTTLVSLAGILALLFGSGAAAVAGVAACGLGFANVWPLIFSLVVERSPGRAGELSGLMCTAIFGGAAVPPIMGFIGDRAGIRWSFLVPLASFAYLALLAAASRAARPVQRSAV